MSDIDKAKVLNDPKLFKNLSDNILEFCTKYDGLQYRLLAFWDKAQKTNTLIVLTHGFIKKVDKLSLSEINKAEHFAKIVF